MKCQSHFLGKIRKKYQLFCLLQNYPESGPHTCLQIAVYILLKNYQNCYTVIHYGFVDFEICIKNQFISINLWSI